MSELSEFIKVVAYIAATLAIVTALVTGIRYFNAPINTAIDYSTFKESGQYNDGMARDLDNFRQVWIDPKTTDIQRDAIRSTVKQRFGAYDSNRLPSDQRSFLREVRGY
jgi:hypothetical protein